MRIGLFGLGRIGAFHASTLAGLPAVEELVVADLVPSVAERVTAELAAHAPRVRVEIADSADALLRAGVDGVVVAAATDAHPTLVVAAVEAGVPVFCEKPIAGQVAHSVEVARRVADTGVQVQIGYQRRFDPAFLAAREAVASGELGWVHTVRSTTLDPSPPPAAYIAVSGGCTATAASTTTTPSAGSPAARSPRSTPPAPTAAPRTSPRRATSTRRPSS